MKCFEERGKSFGAVTILANGEPCAEFNAQQNSRDLSCWIPVEPSQTITIDYQFNTRGVCFQVDLIVDGCLRDTSTIKSKKVKNFYHSGIFETGYYKAYSGSFNPATMSIQDRHWTDSRPLRLVKVSEGALRC